MANVLTVQFTKDGIFNIIEQGGRKDAFVAREVNWLEEWRVVDVVRCTPRAIHPMGTGLKDVVLEIVLVFEQETDGFGLFRKLLQAPEVPLVEGRQVVLGHSVPGQITLNVER